MEASELDKIEQQVNSQMGPEDTVWFRGAPGTPYMHNAPGNHCASVEFEMGWKLRDLVINHKPETLIEVGTNKGFSTFWLMMGMERNQKGHLYTFDIENFEERGESFYWRQFGLPADRVTFNQSRIWEQPPCPKPIDFVFEDASHEVDDTQKIVEWLAPQISKGGVMAFHDIFLCRHEGDFLIRWFLARPNEWDYKEICEGRGLGVAIKK